MRYATLSCTEFYPYYLQQCHSMDLFSYKTPGHGQKCHMNNVCPSYCSDVFMELDLQFFSGTQHGVRGPCGVVYDRARQAKPRVFEFIGKFSFFSQFYIFFISVVYNKSLYYCNPFMLEQISYLGKLWFLRFDPKCSQPIRLQGFSINRRTLKLVVSHKEINEINWFLVCPSNSFLRNGSLGFSDFWHNGR